jgi:UDP-glucuronate 4-epimerase
MAPRSRRASGAALEAVWVRYGCGWYSALVSERTVLVTGAAGFIGYHLCERLLRDGARVVGVDNLNDYYSVELKQARLARLETRSAFEFHRGDISEPEVLPPLLQDHPVETVFHLAAQAGVRYSLDNPRAYTRANVDGTLNLLEAARSASPQPSLLLASSSSVYGLSERHPFREDDPADRPVALYGATKRATELMAHAYAHLFGLRVAMLRFFTVYGPWGRPDMALFRFVKSILEDREVELFNAGEMVRDFTYVDDVVDGVVGLEQARLAPGQPLFDIFNIGAGCPRRLREFLAAIERGLGRKARVKLMPFQPGDVAATHADVSHLASVCGYAPKTSLEEGIDRFLAWYLEYHGGQVPR